MHPADSYEQTKRRVVAIANQLDPDLAIAACPGWSVRDVIAHLTGLASDVATGRLDGYAGPAWTARQVDDRAEMTLPQILEEWDRVLPDFLEVSRDLAGSDLPDTINHILGPLPKTAFETAFHVDLLHHEHDLLGAGAMPRHVPLPADLAVMKAQLANVRMRFSADNMPTLRIAPTDADRTWDVGTDTPAATLSASSIELLRAFGGRRTHEQIRSLAWSGEVDGMAERLVLPFFAAPTEPLPGG